ncbi:nitroreductase family protein [Salinibacterium sp. SYSU T00001]|uniref:nitroreductase family protein n=1 Tax=Homoserinimonas sedimenticola TaxID=2986805 RepID=UPI002235B6B6|nr:nitroreductase family protein [Salinibacterium sedimenticola]MCW4386210.1 nitroreductase family protein [Salinibacterium sedimenticola]
MSSILAGRRAETSVPIDDVHATRWSPRAFDPEATIDEATLATVLEAARWAPSARNAQPWRFVVGRRGTATHAALAENLMGFNREWAPAASALILNIAVTKDAAGDRLRWAEYDLGQAVAHLTLQAQRQGLHSHQMGGIEVEGLRQAFDLGEHLVPVSITALGVLGDPQRLPERLRLRELAPRERLPLNELVLARD